VPKLQALLDDKVPNTTFICSLDENKVIMLPDLFKKEKRTREQNVTNDDDEKDDDDDIEVKPKHSVLFKVDESECPPPELQTDWEVQG
jgi:uncharacterized protein YaaQ